MLVRSGRLEFRVHTAEQRAFDQVNAPCFVSQALVSAGKPREPCRFRRLHDQKPRGKAARRKVGARRVPFGAQPKAIVQNSVHALFRKLRGERKQVGKAAQGGFIVPGTKAAVKQGEHQLVAREDDRALIAKTPRERRFAGGDAAA